MIWEQIDEKMRRAKVKGGWLVQHLSSHGICMAFVPDPMHGWTL